MLKRIIAFCLVFGVFISSVAIKVSGSSVYVSASSAILLNADTGEIIYEKNANERRGIASTTKIMTALLAIEQGNWSEEVAVQGNDVLIEGTSIGLKAGDKVSLETLVYGMLLESGNDAANVTASAVAGDRARFVDMMNERALSLGLNNTSFKNPSGLTQDGHYSTAYDMAVLACCAVSNEAFRNICSAKTYRAYYGGSDCFRTFRNHNKLLGVCDGVFGVKTGFTKASGRCLVSAAMRDDTVLVAVTLNASDDWNDHKKLYDLGFSKLVSNKLNIEKVKIPVVGSDKQIIEAEPCEDINIRSLTNSYKADVQMFCERFLYADVKKGDVVGFVRVVGYMGRILFETNLIASEGAARNF